MRSRKDGYINVGEPRLHQKHLAALLADGADHSRLRHTRIHQVAKRALAIASAEVSCSARTNLKSPGKSFREVFSVEPGLENTRSIIIAEPEPQSFLAPRLIGQPMLRVDGLLKVTGLE